MAERDLDIYASLGDLTNGITSSRGTSLNKRRTFQLLISAHPHTRYLTTITIKLTYINTNTIDITL